MIWRAVVGMQGVMAPMRSVIAAAGEPSAEPRRRHAGIGPAQQHCGLRPIGTRRNQIRGWIVGCFFRRDHGIRRDHLDEIALLVPWQW